jgi:peptidyl-prolyl cis-trans isomerase D
LFGIFSKDIQQVIIKFILALIALVFVFWGFGGYNTRKSVIIATVNGVDITRTEHEKAYDRMLINFKNQMSQLESDVSGELLKKLNFRRRALDEIIKKIILEQEAKKLNFSVNNQEIKDAIKNYPEFQHDGRFNIDRYRYVLKQNRILPSEFERNRKEILTLSKIENIITDSVQVNEDEVLSEYKKRNEKVSIAFIAFNPIDFKDEVKLANKDLKEYFDENSSAFDIPPRVKVEILAFENDLYSKKVRIEEEEMRAYYEDNGEDFMQDEKVKVSHVLIKSEIGDDPQLRDEAKKKAEEVLAKLSEEEDFTKLAKQHSQDTETAMDGGNLGWIKRDTLDKSFEEAAFLLEAGEVSDVVESKEGFHIIKAFDKKERKKKELNRVKDGIIEKLSLIKGKKLIEDLTRKARKEVFLSKNLAEYSAKHDIKHLTPPPFAFSDKVEGVGKHTSFNREVFEVEEGDVSDIIYLNNGSYIVKVIEKMPSKTPEFEEVKEKVREKVIEVMSKEAANSKAEEALKKALGVTTFEDVAKEYNLTVKSANDFTREGASVPKIGISEELISTAFSLSSDNPYPNKIFTVKNKRYLIKFAGAKEISIEEYEKEKPLLIKQLRMEKADRVFESYVESLTNKADIKIFEDI